MASAERPRTSKRDDGPFRRFEDLARKLVQVPKKEVKEAEARREKRPRR